MPHNPITACRCDDCEAFFKSKGVPDWLRMGARVQLPGGPLWVVKNIVFFSHSPDEVQVVPVDDPDGPGATWKLRDFIAAWDNALTTSRFDREDVL